MAIKIRIPKSGGEGESKKIWGLPRDPVLRAAFVAFLILAVSLNLVIRSGRYLLGTSRHTHNAVQIEILRSA